MAFPVQFANLTNATGAQLDGNFNALSANTGGSLIGFLQSGAGAVARTAQGKLSDVVSVFDFMTTAQIADVQAGTLLLDVSAAVQSAINSGAGKVYAPPGKYKMSSGLTIANKNGFTLEGAAGALTTLGTTYIGNTVFVFDSAAAGINSIDINTFLGIRIANIVVSQMRGGAGGGSAIYFHGGHDFQLDNVKVTSSVGVSGFGILLGDGTGAGAAFLGTLRNLKVMTGGEDGIISRAGNTSLTIDSCYTNGGAIHLIATHYSTLNSCASENASYGYVLETCSGITLNACGAEANQKGAFNVTSGSTNIIFNTPFGATNNSSATTNIGDLVNIDSSLGAVSSVTINNPTSLFANGATTANIYANASSGRIVVNDALSANIAKGISGDATWQNTYLSVSGDVASRVFTATQGTGWTFTGTPTFTSHFIRNGNVVDFQIDISGYTNVSVVSAAQITLPFSALYGGVANIYNDNAIALAVGYITGATIFIPAISLQTVPLHIVGRLMTAQ